MKKEDWRKGDGEESEGRGKEGEEERRGN